MKKENKEMLKTIISNQELIMKALKIEIPVKVTTKESPKKVASVSTVNVSKKAVKKVSRPGVIKKVSTKSVKK